MRTRYRERSAQWSAFRVRLREHAARYIPKIVMQYPFEVLAVSVGLIIGLPLVLGLAAPTSLVLYLPTVVYWIYASMLSVGAVVSAIGLRTTNALILAPGLQLLGGSYCVYALATVAAAGLGVAWAAFGCFIVLGLICFVRSSHFRRLIDIQIGASRLRDGGT